MSAMFGSGVDPDDGTPCGACDGTGHVCSDDGTAVLAPGHHGDRLHPWDGLSQRADACDHGGGAPCPVCMIPPGEEREVPPDVVDMIDLVRGLPPENVARMHDSIFGPDARPPTTWRRDIEPVTGPPETRSPSAAGPLPISELQTGLDRVRAAVERDRPGDLGDMGRIISPRVPPGRAYVVDERTHGLVFDVDRRPWWRRTGTRLLSALRGAFRR